MAARVPGLGAGCVDPVGLAIVRLAEKLAVVAVAVDPMGVGASAGRVAVANYIRDQRKLLGDVEGPYVAGKLHVGSRFLVSGSSSEAWSERWWSGQYCGRHRRLDRPSEADVR